MTSHPLNGPQTTGRDYRDLSVAEHATRRENDVTVTVRDGVTLLADVHRPDADGRFPVLIAASPYPRQIQDLGAPMGFIEAGVTSFWVSRGYVHVIANLRVSAKTDRLVPNLDVEDRGVGLASAPTGL